MKSYRQLLHVESGQVLLKRIRWSNDFFSKLRGFTFRRSLALDDGLVLVESKDSRVNSAITMLFVVFDLGIIWVSDAGKVVDIIVAKPWRLSYAPKAPARYAVELHPSILESVRLGDHLRFLDLAD